MYSSADFSPTTFLILSNFKCYYNIIRTYKHSYNIMNLEHQSKSERAKEIPFIRGLVDNELIINIFGVT